MSSTLEYLISDEVMEIFNAFTGYFGVRIAFFTDNYREFRVGMDCPISVFCSLVRQDLGREGQCLVMDRMKMKEAARLGTMISYRCHAGLTEAVIPVVIAGRAIGFVMIGQVRTSGRINPALEREWLNSTGRTGDLKAAFQKLTLIPDERMAAFLSIFSSLIDYILVKNMIRTKSRLIVDSVIDYFRENIHEQVTLAEAAQHTGRSETTVTHLFKKETGRGFKETVIEMKLEKAEQYLSADPKKTIGEVSDLLGFHDQFHFSRLYKKYRGITPSHFRKNLEQKTLP